MLHPIAISDFAIHGIHKKSIPPVSSTPLLWDLGGTSTLQQKASKNYTISSKIIQKNNSNFFTSTFLRRSFFTFPYPPPFQKKNEQRHK